MTLKKTETEKKLIEANKQYLILKQEFKKLENERVDDVSIIESQTSEIIRLKKLIETHQANRNEMFLKYEKKVKEQKEQQETINTLRDDLSNANTHIKGLGERIYDTQNALKGYKEFSATLENDVKMMSKAIVKIMMGVERDG